MAGCVRFSNNDNGMYMFQKTVMFHLIHFALEAHIVIEKGRRLKNKNSSNCRLRNIGMARGDKIGMPLKR